MIRKALYGLRSSGLRWWDRCSEILVSLGFQATLAEDDIWIKRVGNHYEYIVRYVDDLGIVSKDPEGIIKKLTEGHGLKLKGTGPIKYHLGCDFHRDKDNILCMSPKSYVQKAISNNVNVWGDAKSECLVTTGERRPSRA